MIFFDHPIANHIETNSPIYRGSLYEHFSTTYNIPKEVERLIAENHIYISGDDLCTANYRVLEVKYKGDDVVFDTTQLSYTPQKELQKYFIQQHPEQIQEYIDDETFGINLFCAGIPLSIKDKEYFEIQTPGLHLDFDTYNYIFFGRYYPDSEEKEDKEALKQLKVVFLDDHVLYAKHFENFMKENYLPSSEWYFFEHPNYAIEFLEESYKNKEHIHIVITDFNHLGLDGCEFPQAVQTLEDKYNAFESSKILVSFQPVDSEPMKEYELKKLFNRYFSKGDNPKLIGSFIKNEALRVLHSNSFNTIMKAAPPEIFLPPTHADYLATNLLLEANLKVNICFEHDIFYPVNHESPTIEIFPIPFHVISIDRIGNTDYTFNLDGQEGNPITLSEVSVLTFKGQDGEEWKLIVSDSIIYKHYAAKLRRHSYDLIFTIHHNYKRLNQFVWLSENHYHHLNLQPFI